MMIQLELFPKPIVVEKAEKLSEEVFLDHLDPIGTLERQAKALEEYGCLDKHFCYEAMGIGRQEAVNDEIDELIDQDYDPEYLKALLDKPNEW